MKGKRDSIDKVLVNPFLCYHSTLQGGRSGTSKLARAW
jgi:hypothetical protein